MKSLLNHVAILVESIEPVVAQIPFAPEALGEIEEFPSEGTRELYVGLNREMGRLLFLQAISEGPYKRAFEKRGPGLHHIALDVENIETFVDQVSDSGWLLHPRSLGLYREMRQVFLCRPGVPLLIEVQEVKELVDRDYFIDRVEFPFEREVMLEALSCDRLQMGESIRVLNAEGESTWPCTAPT